MINTVKERIKNLAIQARGEVKRPGVFTEAEFEEKFAELIIRECLSVIEEMNPHDPKRDIDDIFDEVDKHFGVKE